MKKQILAVFTLLALVVCVSNVWAKKTTTLEGVVNVNTASMEDLMLLPGVGEAKAKQIIEVRSNTPFQKIEDLLVVKGIGEKTIAKWTHYIVFDGDTNLKVAEAQ